MKKRPVVIGATVLIAGVVALTPGLTQAYRGDPEVQGPNCTSERHQALTQALENNDYQAWQKLMSERGKVSQLITAENFTRFAEAHRLVSEGRPEEAQAIRAELGLGQGRQNRNNDDQGESGKSYRYGVNL